MLCDFRGKFLEKINRKGGKLEFCIIFRSCLIFFLLFIEIIIVILGTKLSDGLQKGVSIESY